MELRLLGPLEVVHDGRRADLTALRERSVLTFLLAEANRVVSVDRLIDRLWAGEPPESANITLRVLVSRLRRALAAIGLDDLVRTRSPGYVIEVPPGAYDVEVFETAVRDGGRQLDAGDADAASSTLREALQLWRGPAFGELADHPALAAESARLEEQRLAALEKCIDADLARGRHDSVVADLEAACADHPLRERFWQQRMIALYRCGRQAEALRSFQALRAHLGEELGLEPSDASRRLEAEIVRHAPELDSVAFAGRSTPLRSTVTVLVADPLPAEARDLVGAHAGFLTESGYATFATASDAASAAIELRRQSVARVALHSGEVYRIGQRVRGVAVDRAARILRVAHPGQMLASSATFHLVRDLLPDGLTFVDLGDHRLDDLGAAERLYQLDVDDIETSFPPLASLDARRHNLPRQATSFVGRAGELEGLRAAVERSTVVTVVGAAGVGKTRLALQMAAEMLAHFPDGVRVCALASVRTGDAVATAVATALGVGHGIDGVAEHLTQNELLVVIDNCEQVIDEVAALVATATASGNASRVLVTSREALGVDGELIWQVRPLASDDAGQLFVDRARAARREFDPTDDDLAVIAAICRRLDGIPLAIELAAARTRFMSVREIEARLDERFRLLTGGSRVGLERHRTLRAAVAWSYDLLAPEERIVLDRLSVFVSKFDARAAEAVVSGEDIDVDETLDHLASLASKSMVEVDSSGTVTTYRLLETIRELGLEHLADRGELDVVRRRHAQHFAVLVAEAGAGMRTADELQWMDWIEDALDELGAAVRWAVGAGEAELGLALCAPLYFVPYFFSPSGREVEIGSWAEDVLALPGARTSPLFADGCAWAAIGRYGRGDEDGTNRFVALGHEALDDAGLPRTAVLAAMAAFRSLTSGNWGEGALIMRTAIDEFPLATPSERAPLYAGLALLASASGDRAQAEDAAAMALEAAATLGPAVRSLISTMVGNALTPFDEDRAIAAFQEALVLDTRHTAWSDVARSQMNHLLAPRQSSATPRLRRRLEELVHAGRRFGGARVLAAWLAYLAGSLADQRRDLDAATLFGIVDSGCIADWSMLPVDADRLQGARERLGDAAFTTAHARGAHMTYDEATTFAIACLDDGEDRSSGVGSNDDRVTRRDAEGSRG